MMASLRGLIPSPRLLTAVAVSLIIAGCSWGGLVPTETGSGNLVTETRNVEPFSRIEASGAIHLDLHLDTGATQSVTVTYDDNILDKVVTRVDGDRLVLELEGSVNFTDGADRVIAVTMPSLVSLEASGATSIAAEGVASSFRLEASGASRLDLRDVEAVDIDIDISGASSVDLFATGTISGSVSGASEVSVHGEPVSVLIDSSGASSVDIVN